MESSARALFTRKPYISSEQRKMASLFWRQLLLGERIIPQANGDQFKPIKNEMLQLLSQRDRGWDKNFTNELDTLLFENRYKKGIKLNSNPFPEDLLLRAANNSNTPLAVFPRNISMSFNDDNSICVNNVPYLPSQILNPPTSLFFRHKPQESMTMALSSKNIFHSLKTKPALLTLGLVGVGLTWLSTVMVKNKMRL